MQSNASHNFHLLINYENLPESGAHYFLSFNGLYATANRTVSQSYCLL